ncbi:MAG: glutamate transport system permease protein [Miltoncostaeaceae bacterium]|nr:glutamate transport system permease protein [Miltoncostaeaceae bacterium]
MSARAPVIGDPLGPRGRRRALVASVLSALVLAGLIALVVARFADRGQLDRDRWDVLLDPDVLRFLLGGLGHTLELFAVAAAMALPIAVLAALGRLALSRPVRWTAGTYVEVFRALPLLLQILFLYVFLPEAGIHIDPLWVAAIGLALYNGAVMGEIVRAGVLSLERGQSEAARAIGLSYWESMRLVLLPQAARRMIPAGISQMITLLKDTSLAYVVAFEELLRRGRIAGEYARSPLQALLLVAAMYIAVNFTLSRIARRLEVRQRRRYGAGPIAVAGAPEDLSALGTVDGRSDS